MTEETKTSDFYNHFFTRTRSKLKSTRELLVSQTTMYPCEVIGNEKVSKLISEFED